MWIGSAISLAVLPIIDDVTTTSSMVLAFKESKENMARARNTNLLIFIKPPMLKN